MYSPNSSFNPFQCTQNQIIITSSTQEDHSSSFLHFPSHFLDQGDLLLSDFSSHHHHQQQPILVSNTNLDAETIQEMNPAASSKKATRSNNKKNRSNMNGTKQPIPRKRTGKKDRHSKIHTAQGPRDRRMRLSLQIARKFFDLQDMLGFDKASKTIDWLFTKSKAAIKELTDSLPRPRVKRTSSGGSQSLSATSESEDMSSSIKLTPDNGDKREMVAEDDSFVSIPRQKRSKKSNKLSLINPLARESRDKARARARERTKEKQKIQGLEKSKHYSQANPNNLEQLGPASSLENGENLGFGSQEMKSPSKMAGEEDQEEPGTYLLQHQMNSVSIIDKFLGLTSAPKSSLIFDLSHNVVVPSGSGADFEDEFSGFPGNWDISDARVQNRRCAMPSMKLSRGNVNVQNPNAIFMATPIAQEYKPSSNFITISNAQEQNLNSLFIPPLNTHEENPSSLFINFSNSNERNPSPTPMTPMDTEGLHSRFRQDQLSCNPNAANNYSSLY
ncbi:hypothetical protein P3X46_023063 [Hevea brasiliensis]|uniref:TCP domain-containing protein n=1 Tax=Hevea brasiliensis TaxID=3981 RepID=A0ABQ9L9W3_HEVBR|nr:transcription factor TCP12-like [Hevea brasiliensis]KAJ9163391.1 hypothetical protein P3X46_023063 [Hevea brasiliensis]